MKIVVGISGASGAPYARRTLEALRALRDAGAVRELGVVLSRSASDVWRHELGGSPRDLDLPVYEGRDYAAPFASGSAGWHAMAVVPASMSSIARIAQGISDDLLTRAADVMLKERRKLVLVARESPYSLVHLRNMTAVTEAGAVVLPASPSFYGRPKTLDDAIDGVVARLLDQLGLPTKLGPRWGDDVTMGGA